MAPELNDERVQSLVREYKRKENREERIERAENLSALIRDAVEELVRHLDGQIGSGEMSALLRLCQVPSAAKPATKRARVDELDLPDEAKEDIKSQVVDYGIVGGGTSTIPIPTEYERQTYQLLEALVSKESKAELDDAIDQFAALNISGVQAGVLSPIIFFLHPTKYPVINSASREGMTELMNYNVSSQLSEYTTEAEKYREFRDQYDLGGEKGNLRDVDWFFYTLNTSSQPSIWIEKMSHQLACRKTHFPKKRNKS